MASAYKSTMRAGDDSDSEPDFASFSDEESSRTLSAHEDSDDVSTGSDEEDEPLPDANLAQLPVELRNRILMLTTRGVSHRCGCSTLP